MSRQLGFGLDVLAILILVFGLYFPRHRRRDLIVSYLAMNIGVVSVASALTSAKVDAAGLGFGLFAVLSIIRLRSFELDQQEVAYYFVALALAVLGGVPIAPEWLAPVLMALLLLAIYVGDHPSLFHDYKFQTINLDRAIPQEDRLITHIERLTGARVRGVSIRKIDTVNDTTLVDVKLQLPRNAPPVAEESLLVESVSS